MNLLNIHSELIKAKTESQFSILNGILKRVTTHFAVLIVFLTLSTFNFSAYSQLIGTFRYGGVDAHLISSIVKNNEGEVYMVGQAYNETDNDILVVKLSANGGFLWSKFFGVNGNIETPRSAVTDGEGGICVLGRSSADDVWSGAYLIRIAQDGEIVFSNRYTATTQGSVSEIGITVTRIGDKFYLGGMAHVGSNPIFSDYFIIETELTGGTNWSRSYGATEFQGISTLSEGNDQSIVSTGALSSESPSHEFEAGIGKYDFTGEPIWLRSIAYGDQFMPKSIKAVDDGYVLFGQSGSDVPSTWDLVLVKLNENGETVWSKELHLDGDETATDLKVFDNQILISGYTDGFADQDNNVFLLSFDQDGNKLWEKAINESLDDNVGPERENLIIESIGDFFQIGYSSFPDDGSLFTQFCMTHVSPSQENTCGEFDPNFEVVDIDVDNSAIDLQSNFNFTDFVVGSYSQDTELDSSLCLSEVNLILPDSVEFCYNTLDTIATVDLNVENYLWSTGETTEDIVPQEQGWYWVEGEVNGLLFTDSVFVDIITPTIDLGPDQILCSGEVYEIEPEGEYNSLIWMSGEVVDFTITEAGTYWIEAQIGSCSALDTIEVEVIEEPAINFMDDYLVCSPTDSVLVDSELDESYGFTWDNGGENAQNYFAETGPHWLQVDIEGCTFDYDFEVSLATQNLIEETQFSICDGSSVEIQLTDPGMEGSWNIGESGSSIDVEDAGMYVVEVYQQDCFLSDSVQVEVIESPAFEVDDREICPGSSVAIQTPSFAEQVWLNGNQVTGDQVSLNFGNYELEYLFEECVFSSEFEINHIQDTIDFENHYFICEEDTITLSLDSLYNPVWDGSADSSSFIITEPGSYNVAFEMFDCTFRETIEVVNDETCPCPEPVFIPNSFTPNSDGRNEFFQPVIYCPLDEYKLTIFNRWGHIVFESNDLEKVWDGSHRGGDYFIQNDTYQYVLQFSKKSSSQIEVIRGHVMVVR